MGQARDQRAWVVSAATMFAAIGQAAAQQPPAPPPPAPTQQSDADDEDDDTEIVVVARGGDQVRIDRRTYTVSEDPAAQATEALDILGRIPSVSVAPSGEIRLLGGEGVTVQIDGQAVPGANLEQVLRSLNGSDIERIDVTTNPPASQSASSSAGVINIITRNRFLRGLTGSVQANGETTGSSTLNVSPTWTQGPLTIGGRLGLFNNKGEFGYDRDTNNLTTNILTHEESESENTNDTSTLNLQLAYRFNPRRRMSLNLDYNEGEGAFDQAISQAFNGTLTNALALQGDNTFGNRSAFFLYQQTGVDQSLLKLTAFSGAFENEGEQLLTLTPTNGGPVTQTQTGGAQNSQNYNVKLDFERPFGGSRLMTLGIQFEQNDEEVASRRRSLPTPSPADYQSGLDSLQQTTSAYGTYQFATGDWIWQPGLRAELYRREVVAIGGETDADETTLFPSIHIRRPLSSNIDLDLSYSSRIQRPDANQLDPTVRVSLDGTRANSGNPNLDPTTTDAYEANLTYQNRGSTFSVTLFDRLSEDIVSQTTTLTPGGVLLTTFVNAGESEQRGLQTILRGPLWQNWRYSLSANLLNREFDALRSGVITRRSEFEYSGNAQIEYRDRNPNEPGADTFQFDLQFQGPRASLQRDTEESFMANFTWRRRLTDRLTSTLLWANVFDSNTTRSSIDTGTILDRLEQRGIGPRVRFSLSYQFGSLTSQPQQQDQPPPQAGPAPVQ